MQKKFTIIYVCNSISFFISHRINLALEAKKNNFNLILIAPYNKDKKNLDKYGVKFIKLNFSRNKINFISEMKVIFKLSNLLKSIRPSIVHFITMKPVIYGGLISKFKKNYGTIFAISGLGTSFIDNSYFGKIRKKLVYLLLKIALNQRSSSFVIVQNKDDKKIISSLNLSHNNNIVLIRGSGVNINKFKYYKEPKKNFRVTMVSRLLFDKGVLEFFNAAKILKSKNYKIIFSLIGDIDPENQSSLNKTQLKNLKKQNVINFEGYKTNINNEYKNTNIVCLPSYREGLPKSLIEAAACGRPVVTTDTPGCKEVIINNKTGFLVPPYDSKSLSKAILKLYLDKNLRVNFGKNGRALALKFFDERIIVKDQISIYKRLIHKRIN